jgi:hypothetical protein
MLVSKSEKWKFADEVADSKLYRNSHNLVLPVVVHVVRKFLRSVALAKVFPLQSLNKEVARVIVRHLWRIERANSRIREWFCEQRR